MSIRNTITLIGRLGRDPKMEKTSSGKTYARFPMATSDYYRNAKGERVEQTEWHDCIAWGRLAETLNTILEKGQEVVVNGKLRYNIWEDKDGRKRRDSEIQIENFALIGAKKKEKEAA